MVKVLFHIKIFFLAVSQYSRCQWSRDNVKKNSWRKDRGSLLFKKKKFYFAVQEHLSTQWYLRR